MDPSTSLQNPNSSKHGPGVYQICGVPVEFPYKPYGSQLAFMGRVISTLDRARRQGRCHALLESPTGTGKSLSLLCSSLAWQRHQKSRFLSGPAAPSQCPPLPSIDHPVHGGGFVPETQPSMDAEQPPASSSARAQKRLMAPKIYYASRTHSQISQVIREYRKTSYRVPMAVLASRKHYCTNKHLCTKENVDEECKLLLRDEGLGCPEFKNANKVKSHPSLQNGGCYEVHDIEDLVKVGQSVKGCSYFAAQTLAEEAQIVFCPYSYIVNPIVRRAMDIDIKGSLVILDEAHNIEDVARDGGSLDVEEDVLFALQAELGKLCMAENGAGTYQPLYDMIEGILSWIGDRKRSLQKCDFEHYSSFWSADKAIKELQRAGITQQHFPILQECATKAIKATSDAESDESHLSGLSAITLEGLFSSVSFLFSENGSHAVDYQLALQRYVKRDARNTANGWICKLSLWCLNPAVVFKEIASLSLSVILTSGTLSPMGSFASELGVQFDASMEAPHVINVESQLWAAVVPTGPANCQLNASYRTADGYAFQDGLGISLEEICKIAPGGVLVFFPSYKLLEKLQLRWNQTGQWSRLNAQKPVFTEPRGAVDEFESVLRGYYDAIRGNIRVAPKKNRLGSKRVSKHPFNKVCSQNSASGAAFLAVCRGKVSEGIDFSDENARVVVIVGIPFPNINDIQVALKKKYNDTYRSSKHLLSGSEWYCHQAFRALNQAAGRCIRHRFDYGAIIFLDERFKEERNLMYISKWLKNSIKHFDTFDESLEDLRTFFENAQKQFAPRSSHSTCQDASLTEMSSDFNKGTPRYSNLDQICSEPNLDQGIQVQNTKKVKAKSHGVGKTTSGDGVALKKPNKLTKSSRLDGGKGSLPALKDYVNEEKGDSETNAKFQNCNGDSVDLESSNQKQFKCLENTSMKSWEASSSRPMVNKSFLAGDQDDIAKSVSKVESLYLNVAPSNQHLDRSFSSSTTLSNGTISEGAYTPSHSPEMIKHADPLKPEMEISLNMSVNSHNQKRRLIDLQMTRCDQIDCLSSVTESLYHVDSISSISRETDQISKSPFADNYSVYQHKKLKQETFMRNEHCLSFSYLKTKKLELSCLCCKNQLGSHENNFLVECSLSLSSKVYLAYVLKYGPPKACCLDLLPSALEVDVPVVVCNTSTIDHVFDSDNKEDTSQHDFWSKEDGCVFRILICPFCTVPKACLGVQIIAADASNIHLLNKVLFYADRLDMKDEQKTKDAATRVPGQQSALAEVDKHAYNSHPQKVGLLNARKSKLTLPKRVKCSLEHQEGT